MPQAASGSLLRRAPALRSTSQACCLNVPESSVRRAGVPPASPLAPRSVSNPSGFSPHTLDSLISLPVAAPLPSRSCSRSSTLSSPRDFAACPMSIAAVAPLSSLSPSPAVLSSTSLSASSSPGVSARAASSPFLPASTVSSSPSSVFSSAVALRCPPSGLFSSWVPSPQLSPFFSPLAAVAPTASPPLGSLRFAHKFAAPPCPNLLLLRKNIHQRLQPILFFLKNDTTMGNYVYDQHFKGVLCSPLFEGKSYKEIYAMVDRVLEDIGLSGRVKLYCEPPSLLHKMKYHVRKHWPLEK
uniref:Uncharacterized protein n=1 Tax=Neospora caninum (strain Liverpool) TaxID=572307 RepID=A0A0F7ULE3_NEOCL|nr:TPA: hypothetical protein BN1204_047090 [Neospora caninum Liverpool]